MTLPASAAERRRRVPAVGRYLLHAPVLSSKPAARGTDGRTPDRYVDRALHTAMTLLTLWPCVKTNLLRDNFVE